MDTSAPYWDRAILHVDMDAFYASVEQRDRPELRGKPVIVAGDPKQRGVVSAASYEVRAYGVRSAMPTAKALRLCPHAIRVFPRMERYQEVSAAVFDIFARFTPLIQAVSLDEAFLDVTASQRLHGDPVTITQKIRAAIKTETALTASVGIASCRIDAKIASDLDKPDGLTVISESDRGARLDPLPVSRIWGVGAVTNRRLEKLGILTIGQLRLWPVEALRAELGKAGGDLHALANGNDDSEVVPDSEEKSLSHETTFPVDVLSMDELETTLRWLSDKVSTRLRRYGMAGRVVFLKLRYGDFSTVTRRKTIAGVTSLSDTIYSTARELLRARTQAGKRPVRLIGVGVAGLASSGTAGASGVCGVSGASDVSGGEIEVQGALFADDTSDGKIDGKTPAKKDNARMDRLERAADAIRAKLGKNALQRASFQSWEDGVHDDSNDE